MREEVNSAVTFISGLLRQRNLGIDQLETFEKRLPVVLCEHYSDHWFPEKPFKGSAYRCIRIVKNKMDPLLGMVGVEAGLSEIDLLGFLPNEFTMWVDPDEVSYRIGEEGSIGILYNAEERCDQHETSPGSVSVLQTCKDQLRLCLQPTSKDDSKWSEFLTAVAAS